MMNLISLRKPVLFAALMVSVLIFSCNQQEDYKVVRSEVVALHDKVMEDGERAQMARHLLDSISRIVIPMRAGEPEHGSQMEKNEVVSIITKLDALDTKMTNWMNTFEPDTEGKSNAQAVTYFKGEMQKIMALDKGYGAILSSAQIYLQKFNVNLDSTSHEH